MAMLVYQRVNLALTLNFMVSVSKLNFGQFGLLKSYEKWSETRAFLILNFDPGPYAYGHMVLSWSSPGSCPV